MTILVTGGAGYIGSHVALACLDAGRNVLVVDDLSSGRRELAPRAAAFAALDVANVARMTQLMQTHNVEAVIHLAASVVVPESVADPIKYYRQNTEKTLALAEACTVAGVRRLLFSSTAAVYGEPETEEVRETSPTIPASPYGASKLMAERVLTDVARAHGMALGVLRYFNVAGADPHGRAGQAGREATHLVKVACETAVGKRSSLTIFGNDWPTPDGTAMRDYIHVSDLAHIHLRVLDRLTETASEGGPLLFNCGYGRGYSVREVIDAMQAATGAPLPVTVGPRRPGDVTRLVANVERLQRAFPDLETTGTLANIVASALAWEKRHRAPLENA